MTATTRRVVRFVVPGKPVPAVRMTQRSKHTDPQAKRYLAYKEQVGWKAKEAGVQPIDGPVSIRIELHLTEPEQRRFDLDNVVKAVVDALAGIAFHNDRQMVHLDASLNFRPADSDCVFVEVGEAVEEATDA